MILWPSNNNMAVERPIQTIQTYPCTGNTTQNMISNIAKNFAGNSMCLECSKSVNLHVNNNVDHQANIAANSVNVYAIVPGVQAHSSDTDLPTCLQSGNDKIIGTERHNHTNLVYASAGNNSNVTAITTTNSEMHY